MLSMENFVNNANCFYFQIESSFYQVINNKFFKRNLLKQREFWSLIKILQIILLAISFCHFIYSFIIIHFSFMYLFSLEGMQM